ncbi:MAG: MipA/OmpV family protein [Hyphomicrobiales bacterium]|nr:MipA/OmpV family protein [Hyphomicrobiales bacterium]
MRRLLLALAAASALAAPAAAQTAPGDDLVVTLGGGVRVSPDWDGSKKAVVSPMPIIGLKFLRSPLTGAPSSDTGFGLAPSFRYLSKRSFGAGSPLNGLPDVPQAFEAGLTVDYTDTNFRAFVTARQGMGGHHGQIAELGLDGIVHPIDKLTLAAGPRLSFASADYMRTYYGVSAAAAASSGVAAYDPGAGYRGVGLGAVATWDIDPRWFVKAEAGWTRLADKIANSPVMKAEGARDQFSVGLGVAWRFGVDAW